MVAIKRPSSLTAWISTPGIAPIPARSAGNFSVWARTMTLEMFTSAPWLSWDSGCGTQLAHRNCPRRTRCDAGAAAVADVRVKRWRGDTAGLQAKADCAHCALFTADAALDLLERQATLSDLGLQLPRRGAFHALERPVVAGGHAIGAKGALTAREIDDGITAVAAYDDVGRANLDARDATRAKPEEGVLVHRPWRAHRRRLYLNLPAEKPPARNLSQIALQLNALLYSFAALQHV